jgi:hypothetical protein
MYQESVFEEGLIETRGIANFLPVITIELRFTIRFFGIAFDELSILSFTASLSRYSQLAVSHEGGTVSSLSNRTDAGLALLLFALEFTHVETPHRVISFPPFGSSSRRNVPAVPVGAFCKSNSSGILAAWTMYIRFFIRLGSLSSTENGV